MGYDLLFCPDRVTPSASAGRGGVDLTDGCYLLREGDPRETFCLPQGYPEAPAEQECGKVVKPSNLKEGTQREMGQPGNSEMGCRCPATG